MTTTQNSSNDFLTALINAGAEWNKNRTAPAAKPTTSERLSRLNAAVRKSLRSGYEIRVDGDTFRFISPDGYHDCKTTSIDKLASAVFSRVLDPASCR